MKGGENMKDKSKNKTQVKKPMIMKKSKYVASPALGCNVTSASICGSNIEVP